MRITERFSANSAVPVMSHTPKSKNTNGTRKKKNKRGLVQNV
jgi:hypothetical protein